LRTRKKENGLRNYRDCVESQHIRFQSNKFIAFQPVTPEEIKFRSARTRREAISEVESKNLMEPDRMKVIENLQAY
jgi:hypothetical protein